MSNQVTEEELRQAQATVQAQEFAKTLDRLVETGRERFGEETFDAMAADAVKNVGQESIAGLQHVLVGMDDPAGLVQFLAENPAEAKRLAQMSPTRAASQLAQIQSRINPNAATGNIGAAKPAWQNHNRRRSPDAVLADDNIDDKQWERTFRDKYKATGGVFVPGYRY